MTLLPQSQTPQNHQLSNCPKHPKRLKRVQTIEKVAENGDTGQGRGAPYKTNAYGPRKPTGEGRKQWILKTQNVHEPRGAKTSYGCVFLFRSRLLTESDKNRIPPAPDAMLAAERSSQRRPVFPNIAPGAGGLSAVIPCPERIRKVQKGHSWLLIRAESRLFYFCRIRHRN